MHRADDYDIEINIRDLFFYVLAKWKFLILFMIIGAAAAGSYSYYKSEEAIQAASEINSDAYSDDQLEAAKSSLSDDEASNVESIYRQYRAYQKSQQTMADKFADSVFWTDSDNGFVIKLTKYCVESDILNITGYFRDMSLTADQISEIREIIGDDDKNEDIDDLISIYGSSTANVSSSESVSENGTGRYKSLVTVSVIAANQDQCDAISGVIDGAFQSEVRSLQKADPDIVLTYIDADYTDDVEDYIISKQQEILTANSSIISSITSLQNNQISQFSDEEKAYYDLLTARDTFDESTDGGNTEAEKKITADVSSPTVSKKYVALGIFAGLVLAVLIEILKYVSDQTLKIPDDITSIYNIPLFGHIKMSGKKNNSVSRDVQEELLASDISITAGKNNLNSCYFVTDAQDADFIHEIMAKVEEADEKLHIESGQPLTDTAELNKMASMDAIVLIVHLKKTQLTAIDKIGDLVNRFDVKVIGAIAVED